MPDPKDFLPHLPHEGPPVPRLLPGWPATIDDVNEAVWHYATGATRAVINYQASWHRSIENYRQSLLQRLP